MGREMVLRRLAAELRESRPAVDGDPEGFLRPIRQAIDTFPRVLVSSAPAADSQALGSAALDINKLDRVAHQEVELWTGHMSSRRARRPPRRQCELVRTRIEVW